MDGRGSIKHAIVLGIEQRWTVDHSRELFTGVFHHSPQGLWWNIFKRYNPGKLLARHVSGACPQGFGQAVNTLTRLTFTAADGTEFELRDTIPGGPNGVSYCSFGEPLFNRGRTFKTYDGTSAAFIADTDVFDSTLSGTITPMTGYLMLRDGTRYRFDNGDVSWIRDRNGNKITFNHDMVAGTMTITDPLNRQTLIEYDITEPHPYGLCDRITFKGFGGASRTIRVSIRSLSQTLRTTQPYDHSTVKTYQWLFPELNAAFVTDFDPSDKVSAVWLPDERRYQISYNVYGEVARVDLPTGGAIEYDWEGGEQNGNLSGVTAFAEIYRRVITRRVYADGSLSSLVSKTTYSKHADSNDVTVRYKDASDVTLSQSKHYFYTNILTSLGGLGPFSFESWLSGKESQTESLNSDGSVIRRVTNTWQQRAPVSWWIFHPDLAPPNDPRLVETISTLADASPNLVSKQTMTYDAYNNVIDVYEYDFGIGAPGPLIRRAHTDYVTFNNGVDYAGDYNIHIRNLPLQTQVFDAGGIKRAETFCEYDLYDNSPNHAPLIDRPGISGLDSGFTNGYTTRGNVTRTSSALLNSSGGVTGWVNSHAQYDIAGNVIKVIDSNGNATQIDFRDNFGSPDDPAVQSSENPANNAPGELGGQMSYAFPFKITNALGHKAYTKYDYYLGRATLSEDPNGVKLNIYYNDALDRPTRGIRAIGTSDASQTIFVYNDSASPVNGYPAHSITTISDKDVFGESNSGNGLKSVALYDELGRTWRGAAYEGSTWTIKDAQFDALGRVSQVSNPYRAADPGSASPPSGLWTTSEYDALGRPNKVTTPDGAHVDTAYSGNNTLVIDQAGKKRISRTDALGRLTNVWEVRSPDAASGTVSVSFPNYPEITAGYQTDYLYDSLGNLRNVDQGGKGRWFSYDSLSRLIRVRNMEQDCNPYMPPHTDPFTGGACWSSAYSYDANGNLVSKTDPRNITTTYDYDELNRNTTVDYSDTTAVNPDIVRQYDGATNGKGRFWGDYARGFNPTDQVGEHNAIDSYDALGRPLTRRHQFRVNGVWSAPYSVSQTYDLAGNVKRVTYPSGRAVDYSHDQDGRLSSSNGNLGGGASVIYADTIDYNAAGQMIKERFGTNTSLYHNRHYNNRQQLASIRVGDNATNTMDWSRVAIDFFYGATAIVSGNPFANDTDNNGNLRRQITHVPLAGGGYVIPQQDDYTYDALNRISSFTETRRDSGGQWIQATSQNFSYDRYGNRWITSATGGVNSYNPTYDTTNYLNRIVGLGYDAAGNITLDPLSGRTMTYDAENRLLTATNGGVGSSYTYDADGRRVRRIIGGQETWHVYGIGGELLAEYGAGGASNSPQKEYGYRNGQMLVVWDGSETGDRQLQWLVQDHLGSTRMVVDRSGSLGGVRRHDFAPFGEELGAGIGIRSAALGYGGDSVRQKFTGYEHDNETGLDFAQARYFASVQGRFTSTDPLLSSGRPDNPQTWNRYSYSLNNPLLYVDPSGMFVFARDLSDEDKQKIIDAWVALNQALNEHKEGSKAYNNIKRSLDRLGRPGEANGVTVAVGELSNNVPASTNVDGIARGQVTIKFDRDHFDSNTYTELAGTLGHEGSHAADAFQLFSDSGRSLREFARRWNSNDSQWKSEFEAWFVNAGVHEAWTPEKSSVVSTETPIPGQRLGFPGSDILWNPSWKNVDRQTIESNQDHAIGNILQTPRRSNYGPGGPRGYGLKRPR